MKFSLEMDLGSDAMNSSEDLADALRKVATRIYDHKYVEQLQRETDSFTRGIVDVNGNSCGWWTLQSEEDFDEQED